jgi:hypothetical protein
MFWLCFDLGKRCILLLFLDYWLNKYNNKAHKINIKQKNPPYKPIKRLFFLLFICIIGKKREKGRIKQEKKKREFFIYLYV